MAAKSKRSAGAKQFQNALILLDALPKLATQASIYTGARSKLCRGLMTRAFAKAQNRAAVKSRAAYCRGATKLAAAQ
jgi:hypothetical protein